MGNILQVQRFSLFDGPGVRTVVFLKGCPLQCAWCHNPEGQSFQSQVLYNPQKCIGCMDCIGSCPNNCHQEAAHLHFFDRSNCIGCGACAAQCCTGALSLAGTNTDPETVLQQVLRDRDVYAETGGGLTLSGGEPLAQAEFAIDLLRQAKQAGLHTAVETSGYVPAEVIRKATEYTDLFLYDYKVTDDLLHKKFCGVSNKIILSNLQLLDSFGAEVILRCPIIPGINDDPGHICGIATVAAAHSCIHQVHLEPYHRLGTSKAAQLGLADYFDADVPDKEQIEQYRCQIEAICQKTVQISF